jgi:hypothetical protein
MGVDPDPALSEGMAALIAAYRIFDSRICFAPALYC